MKATKTTIVLNSFQLKTLKHALNFAHDETGNLIAKHTTNGHAEYGLGPTVNNWKTMRDRYFALRNKIFGGKTGGADGTRK